MTQNLDVNEERRKETRSYTTSNGREHAWTFTPRTGWQRRTPRQNGVKGTICEIKRNKFCRAEHVVRLQDGRANWRAGIQGALRDRQELLNKLSWLRKTR